MASTGDREALVDAIETEHGTLDAEATPGEHPVFNENDGSQISTADVNYDDNEKVKFDFKSLWYFTGPGFLMSIAYLDPGNIESDLKSGAVAEYKLLWILLLAHILGLVLQRLSAILGVVTGEDLAQMAYRYYPKVPRLILWAMIEIAIVCSDMQEVIGTAIAFYLLSNGFIRLGWGVVITMCDTLSFLFFENYGIRRLEMLFALLISVMAITFGFEFVVAQPSGIEILKGTFIPWCSDCHLPQFLQAISVVGAVIMPHNLYLHSALVKSRQVDRTHPLAIKKANFYFFLESAIALTVSFFINLFVVAVFAHGLYGKTNDQILAECPSAHEVFPNNTNPVDVDIYSGGIFLGCEFGIAALYVWAVGIFAAGQSSTMTGTYAGQFVMEGFLNIQWPRWRRVLFTRSVAILPTLALTFKADGIQSLTGLNDLLNCVQMIQLPFALFPIITITANPRIMHQFTTSRIFQVFAVLTSFLVIGINIYFSLIYVTSSLGWSFDVLIPFTIGATVYFVFVAYLTVVCFQALGWLGPFKKWFVHILPDNDFQHNAPWIADYTNESIDSAP